MTRKAPRTPQRARAATISLGGEARAHPDLQGLIRPLFDADQQPVIQRHPANPRRGDHDAIVKSIRNNGVYSPIKVQRSTGYVLAGNHTLDAILDQGGTSAPWVWLDVDDAEARRVMLDDNHVGELGGYDDAMLLESLRAAEAAGDLLLSSYTIDDLAAVEAAVRVAAGPHDGLTDPDDAPDLPEGPPISQTGDVWRLGPHRLVVGDSTTSEAYDLLLGDELAACVWTDPPYGVNYVGQTKAALTIQNDDQKGLTELLSTALGLTCGRSQIGASWYVAYADKRGSVVPFLTVLHDLGIYRQNIAWVKNSLVLGHGDYHSRYEPIAYGWKPGAARLHPVKDRTQDTVWEIPRPSRSEHHPTMKPVELVARALRNSTAPGDIVLDPFAGSGTTLIACHQQDRTARLIELDPRYADVICRRYQQHTGTIPVRDGQPVDFLV